MIVIKRDEKGWHWTLYLAGEGSRILAVNETAYSKKSHLLKDLERIRSLMPDAHVIERIQ